MQRARNTDAEHQESTVGLIMIGGTVSKLVTPPHVYVVERILNMPQPFFTSQPREIKPKISPEDCRRTGTSRVRTRLPTSRARLGLAALATIPHPTRVFAEEALRGFVGAHSNDLPQTKHNGSRVIPAGKW